MGDSTLDEADIVEISNYVLAKFDPTLAAGKVLDPASPEGVAALELLENVKKLQDGVTFEELLAVARSAAALI